jgi:hypothetical protein
MSAQMNNYKSLYGESNPKRNIEDCEFVDQKVVQDEPKFKRGIAWGQAGGQTLETWTKKKAMGKSFKQANFMA